MLNSYVGGIPVAVILVVVLAVLCWLLLRRTVFGQNVIATGGSEETAWLSGVRVDRVKIAVYALSGVLAGVGGLVIVARINAAQTDAGSPYLLTAIASAVIGGANLMGGEGRIAGTLVGALILGALTNGLVLLNVPSFYEQIVTGLVVVIAVALDQGSKGWPHDEETTKRRSPRRRKQRPDRAPPLAEEALAAMSVGRTPQQQTAMTSELTAVTDAPLSPRPWR